MIKLPKKCYVNKFLPKKIFYEKLEISSGAKEVFVNFVEKIVWLYKISQDTTGITKTENIEEIEVIQLELKEKKIPYPVIKIITKGIPYKILFILKYKDEHCFVIKVDDVYNSEWNKNIEFDFNVLNLEILYENIVKSVIGEENNKNKFNDIIKNKTMEEELKKRISILKTKIKHEKQFNRKVELNNELNKLIDELENFN